MVYNWEKKLKKKLHVLKSDIITVAATDLFPFANQCPRQEIPSLTNQSTDRAH